MRTQLMHSAVQPTNRNLITAIVTFTANQVEQLASDPSYRCMLYCAAVEPLIGFTKDTDISFPHQVELRVNDVLISGLNLRGLKNKSGTTRPADITDRLTKKANCRNEISLTYAMTNKVGRNSHFESEAYDRLTNSRSLLSSLIWSRWRL